MPDDAVFVAIMAVLVVLSGSASGSETAFFSLSDGQISEMSRDRDRLGHLAVRLLMDSRRLLLSILILNNAINIAYFALASLWAAGAEEAGHHTAAGGIMVGSLATLILIGEILPKVVMSANPRRFASILAPFIYLVVKILKPACSLLERALGRFADPEASKNPAGLVTGAELKLVIEHSREHGTVSELVHDRLIEVIDLSDTPVKTVMTHRVDCCSIPTSASRDEARTALQEHPGPYLMVYDDNDDCVGLLTAQDLLKKGRPGKRMRKPLYVPASASLAQALELFQTSRRTAAVVVDEYGGTNGLLTLAHLGNELLGPAASEDLPEMPEPKPLGPNAWLLHGQTPLEAWEPVIEEEDRSNCTTIGGFIAKMLGTVPQPGDRLLYKNLLFQIREVERRRIRALSVEKLTHLAARRMTREGQR